MSTKKQSEKTISGDTFANSQLMCIHDTLVELIENALDRICKAANVKAPSNKSILMMHVATEVAFNTSPPRLMPIYVEIDEKGRPYGYLHQYVDGSYAKLDYTQLSRARLEEIHNSLLESVRILT